MCTHGVTVSSSWTRSATVLVPTEDVSSEETCWARHSLVAAGWAVVAGWALSCDVRWVQIGLACGVGWVKIRHGVVSWWHLNDLC